MTPNIMDRHKEVERYPSRSYINYECLFGLRDVGVELSLRKKRVGERKSRSKQRWNGNCLFATISPCRGKKNGERGSDKWKETHLAGAV